MTVSLQNIGRSHFNFWPFWPDVWPELETNWGKISHARLRRIKAEAQIELWRQRPPSGPVIVAGTTASIPATRDLLLAIADLPNSEILYQALILWLQRPEPPGH